MGDGDDGLREWWREGMGQGGGKGEGREREEEAEGWRGVVWLRGRSEEGVCGSGGREGGGGAFLVAHRAQRAKGVLSTNRV